MKKETRIYLINADNTDWHESEISDEDFITQAEKEGTIYSMEFFIEKWNVDELDIDNTWIRVL